MLFSVDLLLLSLLVTIGLAKDGQDNNDSTYVPPPSIGHELGIMFGFIGAMVLSMSLYTLVWKVGNKRSAQREAARVEEMRRSGYLDGKGSGKQVNHGVFKEKDDKLEIQE